MTNPAPFGIQRIEFDDFVLRSILSEDVDDGALAWCRDKEIMRFLARRAVRSGESLVHLINKFDGVERILLGIFDRHTQNPLGHVEFKQSGGNRRTTLSIVVGDLTRQRQGIGRKTILVASAFAFRHVGANKLVARIFSGNVGSLRLFGSLGFIEEGILRDHCVTPRDGLQSIHCFALFATPENLARAMPADEVAQMPNASVRNPQLTYRVFYASPVEA